MTKATLRFLVERVRGAFAVLGTVDPPSTPLVLYAVAGFDSEPTVNELAEAAGVSLKTASRTLRVLRKQGWVLLTEDPHDSRMKRVALTRAGESATAIIAASFVQTARRVVAHRARERLSTRRRALSATLITVHLTAGVILGSYVQHILGNDRLLTTTETLSNGYRPGAA